MASVNKKKKHKNSFLVPSALKDKKPKGVKRVTFYTASQRKANKRIEE